METVRRFVYIFEKLRENIPQSDSIEEEINNIIEGFWEDEGGFGK
jgi:hypothetical protein